RTTSHVFAAVRAAAFDYGDSARVSNSEAFARLSRCKQPTGGRTVEDRVADDRVVMRRESGGWCRAKGDRGSRQPFADIVVGVAEHFDLDPLYGKSAQRLSTRAA